MTESISQNYSSKISNEVKHFSTLSKRWWDLKGPFAPLHEMNPIRIKFIHNAVCPLNKTLTPLQDKTVLDIGCGGGILSEPIARMGAHLTAIDAAQESIRAAQEHMHIQNLNINYRHITAEELLQEQGPNLFDVICALELIEHVAEPDTFLNTLSQLIKPKGAIIISTINRTLWSFLVAILGAEYITRKIPIGTHTWSQFLRPHEIVNMSRKHGLVISDIKGMVYNALTKTWTLSDRKTHINFIMCLTKA